VLAGECEALAAATCRFELLNIKATQTDLLLGHARDHSDQLKGCLLPKCPQDPPAKRMRRQAIAA
jgi:hypothetical protein